MCVFVYSVRGIDLFVTIIVQIKIRN
jgi:hypothetical protein